MRGANRNNNKKLSGMATWSAHSNLPSFSVFSFRLTQRHTVRPTQLGRLRSHCFCKCPPEVSHPHLFPSPSFLAMFVAVRYLQTTSLRWRCCPLTGLTSLSHPAAVRCRLRRERERNPPPPPPSHSFPSFFSSFSLPSLPSLLGMPGWSFNSLFLLYLV